MSKSRDVFFYSSLSKYSVECLKFIINNNLKNDFIFINVDKNQGNIPQIITKVPSIFTTGKQLKEDNKIFPYLKEKINMKASPNKKEGIQDYMAWSDHCQFINEQNDDLTNDKNMNNEYCSSSLWDQIGLITEEAIEADKKGINIMKGGNANANSGLNKPSQNGQKTFDQLMAERDSSTQQMQQIPNQFQQLQGNNKQMQNQMSQQFNKQQQPPNMNIEQYMQQRNNIMNNSNNINQVNTNIPNMNIKKEAPPTKSLEQLQMERESAINEAQQYNQQKFGIA